MGFKTIEAIFADRPKVHKFIEQNLEKTNEGTGSLRKEKLGN